MLYLGTVKLRGEECGAFIYMCIYINAPHIFVVLNICILCCIDQIAYISHCACLYDTLLCKSYYDNYCAHVQFRKCMCNSQFCND